MSNTVTVPRDERIYLRDAAVTLERTPHAIRQWETHAKFPKGLHPLRDERGWRFFTKEQVDGIQRWLVEEDIRPGSGLVHYKPTREQVRKHVSRVGPRKREEAAA